MIEPRDPAEADDQEGDYFYFDLSDESHEVLAQLELEKAKEDPLEPITEVTKVEY